MAWEESKARERRPALAAGMPAARTPAVRSGVPPDAARADARAQAQQARRAGRFRFRARQPDRRQGGRGACRGARGRRCGVAGSPAPRSPMPRRGPFAGNLRRDRRSAVCRRQSGAQARSGRRGGAAGGEHQVRAPLSRDGGPGRGARPALRESEPRRSGAALAGGKARPNEPRARSRTRAPPMLRPAATDRNGCPAPAAAAGSN